MLQDGIYEAVFTTSQGTLGVAAGLLRQMAFVGADAMHFYRGRLEIDGPDLRALMEVTRHNFAHPSVFGDQALFSVEWVGVATGDTGYKMQCVAHPTGATVHVTGTLVRPLPR